MKTKLLTICMVAVIVMISGPALADWQRSPASDVDKEGTVNGEGNDGLVPGVVAAPDNSCWIAASANMLAGAGYGTGSTFQERADDIYLDFLVWQNSQDPAGDPHGTRDGGWMDNALTWWLGSANNIWPDNTYDVVTVYGNTNCTPWGDVWGPRRIANWLREYKTVSIGFRWPNCAGGHATTPWGDDGPNQNTMTVNPDEILMADSDRDNGGDFQTYTYDDYTNPNPGGLNNGNGWYFDFSANHAYIIQAVTLSPILSDCPISAGGTQKCVGSYKIHQSELESATDLHYTVYTDYDILGYRTEIDWTTANDPPDITESNAHYPSLTRSDIDVDWDLTDNPVPYCTYVTITTEFILKGWNGVWYDDVHFTYPGAEDTKYLQPPYNDPLGTDIRVDTDDGINRLLADDFECIQTGEITKINLWGSWKNDYGTGPAPGDIQKFHLSIYSDDPVGDNPNDPNDDPANEYSQPLERLWSGDFDDFTETEFSVVQGEYFWDPYTENSLGWDNRIWSYVIEIPEANAFRQQGSRTNPVVYWLGVSAEISENGSALFGWKTTDLQNGWNDAAVAWKDNYILTDEFDYWEDQTSHSYESSGSCSHGPYDCTTDSLRIGSCSAEPGSSARIIVAVTPGTDQVKLRYKVPWAGGGSTYDDGATLYVDGVHRGFIVSSGCTWQEKILTGISAATADGILEIKITDEIYGCDGDIQITYLEVYSTEKKWLPLSYPTGHELDGHPVDMSFGIVTPAASAGPLRPSFGWDIVTDEVTNTDVVDITGGYVVGAFDVYNMVGEPNLLGQYRFVHQHPYNQDPERHTFTLRSPTDQTNCEYMATNFRFGYLYGMPGNEELWQFSEWMTMSPSIANLCNQGTEPFVMTIDWEGRLPYPASNITPADQMPDPPDCSVYLDGDINKDCCVDMLDFAIMAGEWLQCTSN